MPVVYAMPREVPEKRAAPKAQWNQQSVQQQN
jgi:hypothetical protein